MKMNENNNSKSYLSPSLYGRAGIGLLYTLLIVCMGGATIVEKLNGKEYVGENIYGAWWFITLWGLLAVVSLVFLVQKRVHKRAAVFLLHISFVVILAGALVTHLTSQEGVIDLRIGRDVTVFVDKEHNVCHLPFKMRLKSFDIQTYPGTDATMDYRCTIDVEHEGQTEKMCVSMNNIGKAGGYRFYQSSYDEDGQGTHLLVAHDPYGIAVTYTGYLMLFVCLLWTMFSRHTRIRQLYHAATRPLAIVFAFVFVANASATSQPHTLIPSHSQSLIPPQPHKVSSEIAHEFGKVTVLYNGRLCPINTAATDFVTKLAGKASWNGYSADEVFVGWMIYYSEWEQQCIIRIKNEEVRRMLGVEGQWASVRDFYTSNGEYKLRGKANDASLPDATRKAIREADEKIQVVSMFYSSEMLRMFPLEAQPQPSIPSAPSTSSTHSLTWHTPGSTELPLGTPAAEFQFINHAMDYLVQSILVNDVAGAKQMIAKIKLYQREKAGDVLPSKTVTDMEILYNSLLSARWVVFLCLTLSLILCLLLLSGIIVRVTGIINNVFVALQMAYLTLLFVLRWIVSGHVPMSNGHETMLFMALTTLVITILLMRRIPVLAAMGPVVASFCLLVAMLASGSPQITNLMPVLQSPLLSIHVATVMVAYALLALITLIAIQGLFLARGRKQAELERITALSQLMLYPAILMLSIGIFVGAIWANVSWGTYWSWDPKETWALITLMIYAIPLHRSFMPSSPAHYHLYILCAFLTVLMTYFGVNYFLSGMHSYA